MLLYTSIQHTNIDFLKLTYYYIRLYTTAENRNIYSLMISKINVNFMQNCSIKVVQVVQYMHHMGENTTAQYLMLKHLIY